MSRVAISLCLIARNEEAMIGDCLKSAAMLCGQLVVVDTGSDDRTIAIARELGAEVFERPWDDDFAAARNAALEHATGDWVLVLDADERLAPGSAATIRAVLDREGDSFDCGHLRLHDASTLDASPAEVVSGEKRLAEPMYIARLLRRTDDLRYEGIIHESVHAWVVRHGNRQRDCQGDIVHFGAVPDQRSAKAKSQRNIALLKKRLATQADDSHDFTVHGYLAHEYVAAEDHQQAWECIEAGWLRFRQSEPSTLLSVLRLTVARCMLQFMRDDAAGALTSVQEAEAYEGRTPDTTFFRGRAHEMLAQQTDSATQRHEHLVAARVAYDETLAQRDRLVAQRYVRGASSWWGSIRLGTVHLLLGDPVAAAPCFERAITEAPHPMEAELGLAEALLEQGHAEAAINQVEKLVLAKSADAFLILSAALEQSGLLKDFDVAFGQARKLMGSGYLAPHRNIRHGELHIALRSYEGHPTGGRGAIGTVGALMARTEAKPATLTKRDVRPLRTLVRNLLQQNRPVLVDPLLEPAAQSVLPGIGELVKAVVADLGMSIEET